MRNQFLLADNTILFIGHKELLRSLSSILHNHFYRMEGKDSLRMLLQGFPLLFQLFLRREKISSVDDADEVSLRSWKVKDSRNIMLSLRVLILFL